MGGENVQWGEMPWAVAINENGEYACSGTLISKKHVITAAHCFAKVANITTNCSPKDSYSINEIPRIFTVRYGSNCLNVLASPECNKTYPMKETKIVRVELQPFFEIHCRNSDIALLELRDEIDESANYVCLPHRLISDRLISMVVFGWGSNPLTGVRTMNVLQTISINRLMPYRLCRQKWRHLHHSQICTAEINTRGACTGDSGGGLIGQTEEGQWILYGIISFGSDCKSLLQDASPRAQVYTSVSYYAASIDVFTEALFPWIVVD
uniref:Transmembrane protease serine 6 n=1 Tax=Ascaris suum TaxID=6253 RepID=F1LAR3_ASCSU